MPKSRDLLLEITTGTGYKVWRDVMKYGATGNGVDDDWQAIQRAITDGNRCGANCNATSTKGVIIYFPPGKYLISRPIIQYYYTAFVGKPAQRPVIRPRSDFKGIALIDTDFYVPKGHGQNW
jgi:glucan 1,3-beta-glucosidase